MLVVVVEWSFELWAACILPRWHGAPVVCNWVFYLLLVFQTFCRLPHDPSVRICEAPQEKAFFWKGSSHVPSSFQAQICFSVNEHPWGQDGTCHWFVRTEPEPHWAGPRDTRWIPLDPEAFFEELDFGYLHRMKPPIKIQAAVLVRWTRCHTIWGWFPAHLWYYLGSNWWWFVVLVLR